MDEQNLRTIISDHIKAEMERKGVRSISELSRVANMPQTTLNLYTSPERAKGLPNLKHLLTLANFFGLEVWELLCPVSEAERRLMRSFEEWIASKR